MKDALTWDYLPLEIAPAARQMAIDSELAHDCAAGHLTAALRLYRMVPGAVTIGRHQRWRSVVDPDATARHGWDWVRRPTGGGALLHHRELNYSVVISRAAITALGGEGLRTAFGVIMRGLVAALESLGTRPILHLGEREQAVSESESARGLCERSLTRHEISIDGLKAVASAQLTLPEAILQHGTMYFQRPGIDDRFWPISPQLPDAMPRWWDLSSIVSDDQNGLDELVEAIKRGYAQALGVRFHDRADLPFPDDRTRNRIRHWSETGYHGRR